MTMTSRTLCALAFAVALGGPSAGRLHAQIPRGSFDNSFGNNGWVGLAFDTQSAGNFDSARAVKVRKGFPRGVASIYVAGLAGDRVAIAKLDEDGKLDTRFGPANSGIIYTTRNKVNSFAGLTFAPNGDVVVAYSIDVREGENPLTGDFVLEVFSTDGEPREQSSTSLPPPDTPNSLSVDIGSFPDAAKLAGLPYPSNYGYRQDYAYFTFHDLRATTLAQAPDGGIAVVGTWTSGEVSKLSGDIFSGVDKRDPSHRDNFRTQVLAVAVFEFNPDLGTYAPASNRRTLAPEFYFEDFPNLQNHVNRSLWGGPGAHHYYTTSSPMHTSYGPWFEPTAAAFLAPSGGFLNQLPTHDLRIGGILQPRYGQNQIYPPLNILDYDYRGPDYGSVQAVRNATRGFDPNTHTASFFDAKIGTDNSGTAWVFNSSYWDWRQTSINSMQWDPAASFLALYGSAERNFYPNGNQKWPIVAWSSDSQVIKPRWVFLNSQMTDKSVNVQKGMMWRDNHILLGAVRTCSSDIQGEQDSFFVAVATNQDCGLFLNSDFGFGIQGSQQYFVPDLFEGQVGTAARAWGQDAAVLTERDGSESLIVVGDFRSGLATGPKDFDWFITKIRLDNPR